MMRDKGDMPVVNSPMKAAALITPLVLLVLLVMSLIFFKERMLYIDAPHMLFRIINDGRFHIEEHRYGSFISQLFPWIGIRLHIPLMGLMILYSAGFYIFYLSVALLLVYKFRNYGLAILLGLYFTLFVSDTYYWPNNEVHQGIAWLTFTFGVNYFAAERRWPFPVRLVLFFGSFFLSIWTHPLVMLAAVYLWFFYVADRKLFSSTRVQMVLFSVILIVLAGVKFYQGMQHGYDSSKIEVLTGFDIHRLRSIFSSPQFRFFKDGISGRYLLFSVLFITGLISLLANKRYLLFAWTILFATGYVALICVTYWDFTLRSFMESEYMPLVIICCAPFVYYVIPMMRPKLCVAAIAVVYFIRIAFIVVAAGPFSNRVAMMERINEKMKQKQLTKVIITSPFPPIIDSVLISKWGAPVESMFLSKLRGETPQRTFIFLDSQEMMSFHTAARDTLLGAWEKRAAVNINPAYCSIDTSVQYSVLTYRMLME